MIYPYIFLALNNADCVYDVAHIVCKVDPPNEFQTKEVGGVCYLGSNFSLSSSVSQICELIPSGPLRMFE